MGIAYKIDLTIIAQLADDRSFYFQAQNILRAPVDLNSNMKVVILACETEAIA